MTFWFLPPYRKSSLRASAKALLAWGVGYAKRSPRFRRMALGVLNRMPALAVRLREIRLGSQPVVTWYESRIQEGKCVTAHGVGSPQAGPQQQLSSDGINAHQRSPLEAHFHAYAGRE